MNLSPKDVHTRLLLPFFFARRHERSAATQLQSEQFRNQTLWNSEHASNLVNKLYQDEARSGALLSLFGAAEQDGRYLHLDLQAANVLFPRQMVLAAAGGHPQFPLRLTSGPRIEMFLSPFGVGVLSIAFQLDVDRFVSDHLSAAHVLAFNYRLSQLQGWGVGRVNLPHPRDDPERWHKIPPAEQMKIGDPPDANAPWEQRATRPGGGYTLDELAGFFVQPLVDQFGLERQQGQFSVYTVVRFGEQVHFGEPSQRVELAGFLAGLCQVEEPSHAGAVGADLPVENALLNQNHWAAVSCLGAAHLVSDQAGGVAFNEERVARVRDKYFVPYLMAYLQRLIIQRASDAVGAAIRKAGVEPFHACGTEFRQILQDACEFAAVDYLPEVSTREAVNRYYRLSQAGLRVPDAWNVVSQGIANLDAGCRAVHQHNHDAGTAETLNAIRDLHKSSKETLEESKELHGKVEWVEVFIVAVYVAELLHIVGDSFNFSHILVGGFVLIYSTLAMWAAFYILNPLEHVPLPRLSRRVIVAAIAAVLLYLGLGAAINLLGPRADDAPAAVPSEKHSRAHGPSTQGTPTTVRGALAISLGLAACDCGNPTVASP